MIPCFKLVTNLPSWPLQLASRKFLTVHRPSVCVVGAGPAGFYTAQQILKLDPAVTVDIIERLPIPFGLVRYGVAPDHADVKNVISTFTQTANNDRCRFFGNVEIGKDVSISELRKVYDAVALSYGAATDRDLNIPGEDLNGVIPARRFVGWYNGTPEDRDLNVDLNRSDTAVIIGQGNVALDIARILISPHEVLNKTDITDFSLRSRASSKIKNVFIVGRRGPLQVAFTIKELREITKLKSCATHIDGNGKEQLKLVKDCMQVVPRSRKRLTELLIKTAEEEKENEHFNINLLFLQSPLEIVSDQSRNVKSIRFAQNKLIGPLGENQQVEVDTTRDLVEIPCGLVVKSIGYKSICIDDTLPFDHKRGIIPSTNGRVNGEDKLYCSGWLSTGPTGVIATTMNVAFETGKVIVEDLSKEKIYKGGTFESIIENKNLNVVSFSDWEKLNRFEIDAGHLVGKPREKLTNIEEMFKVLNRVC